MTREMTKNDKKLRNVALRIGTGMILFLVLFYGLAIIATIPSALPGLDQTVSEVVTEICTMIAYFLSFVIPGIVILLMSKKYEEYRPVYFRWHLPSVTPLIILAAITMNIAVAYLNSTSVFFFFPTINTGAFESVSESPEVYEVILSILSVAVIPALCEEFLFRGVILSQLMPFGQTTAIITSAALFGMMHQNILQSLYTTLLGIVLGILYVRTRSIWCGVLVHFFNNLYSVIQDVLVNMENTDVSERLLGLFGLLVLAGGTFGVIFLLRHEKGRVDPRDRGSFGVVYETCYDYEEYPVTGNRFKLLMSPTMIIFICLAGASTLLTVLALMVA